MRDVLNTPILFLLFLTIVMLALIHLGQWAGRKWNNKTVEAFFLGTSSSTS